jgi:hypothetical protein
MFARRYGLSPGKWRQKNARRTSAISGNKNKPQYGTQSGQRSGNTAINQPVFRGNLSFKLAGKRSSNDGLHSKEMAMA